MRTLSFCVIALALGLGGCAHGMAMFGHHDDGMTSATAAPAATANCAGQAAGTDQSGQAQPSADCPAPAPAEQPAAQPH